VVFEASDAPLGNTAVASVKEFVPLEPVMVVPEIVPLPLVPMERPVSKSSSPLLANEVDVFS
jgi:hypothetical protein